MKVLALLAVLVAGAVAAPAKLDHLDHDHHHDHHHHPNDPLAPFASFQAFSGYNYDPPAAPSGLYELPVEPSNEIQVTPRPKTTTTTTSPPLTLLSAYLPPDEEPSAANEVVEVIVPEGLSTTMMPMPYHINWGVSDAESGNIFNHNAVSDGTNVSGEYSVLLPDGRMQIVRFTSDPINGYQAEVFYEPAK